MKIPRTLDNPMRAMGVPVDTLIVGIVFWVILFLFDATFLGIISGLVSGFLYQRYRKRSFIRIIARRLYWYLPFSFNPIRKGAKGYEREFKLKKG